MQKESFVFKKSWLEYVSVVQPRVRLDVYEAIISYSLYGTVGSLGQAGRAAFLPIKKEIDLMRQEEDQNPDKETKEVIQENKENNNKNNLEKNELDKSKLAKNNLDKNKLDVKAFVLYFNQTLSNAGAAIPHRCIVTDKRVRAVKARCKEHGNDSLKVLVEKAAHSDFLNGRNNYGWVASLDWLLRPNNFVKVIEGNYDNDRIAINSKSNNYGNTNKSSVIDPRRGTDASNVAVEEYEKGF